MLRFPGGKQIFRQTQKHTTTKLIFFSPVPKPIIMYFCIQIFQRERIKMAPFIMKIRQGYFVRGTRTLMGMFSEADRRMHKIWEQRGKTRQKIRLLFSNDQRCDDKRKIIVNYIARYFFLFYVNLIYLLFESRKYKISHIFINVHKLFILSLVISCSPLSKI